MDFDTPHEKVMGNQSAMESYSQVNAPCARRVDYLLHKGRVERRTCIHVQHNCSLVPRPTCGTRVPRVGLGTRLD